MIRSFKYGNVAVATREFLYVVHTCGDGMEIERAKGSSADERGFRPMCSLTQNLYYYVLMHKA